jgi:hypothetical protein
VIKGGGEFLFVVRHSLRPRPIGLHAESKVRLAGGKPHVSQQNLAQHDLAIAAEFQIQWSSRRKGRQFQAPTTVRSGFGRGVMARELRANLGGRSGGSPDRDLLISLENHVVREEIGQADVRSRCEQRKDEHCDRNLQTEERANHKENDEWCD